MNEERKQVRRTRHIESRSEALQRQLHAYFSKFKGRSLADELIAERRAEAQREAQ